MLEDREPTRDVPSEVQEPTAENVASGKASKLAVWSYVLYNFGNTPFSATIMVLYFPLWLTEQYGVGAALINYTTAFAALLVVLIAPAWGRSPTFTRDGCRTSCSSPLSWYSSRRG